MGSPLARRPLNSGSSAGNRSSTGSFGRGARPLIGAGQAVTAKDLLGLSLDELRTIAISRGVSIDGGPPRADLAHRIVASGPVPDGRNQLTAAVQQADEGGRSTIRPPPRDKGAGASGALRSALEAGDECAALAVLARPTLSPMALTVGFPLNSTALHVAAERGLVAVCRAILGVAGFSGTTKRDACGRFALHCAAHRGHAGACRALLEDPRIQDVALGTDMYQCTALHYAADSGSAEVCEALLEHHCCVAALSAKDHRGNLPIGLAPRGERGAAVRRLLAAAMQSGP
mmetsp:Transcript_129548/g.360936  ORF Transcript_129548/g.360936 Transcript_129548/m.360936 type:complete len:288 (-) Transcript_129548:166-1029(-)